MDGSRRGGTARSQRTVAGSTLVLAVVVLTTACGSGGPGSSPAATAPLATAPTSAASPPAVSVVKDIPFASPHGVQLAVDVYQRDGASNRPAVVLIGPGGWCLKSRETMPALATALARRGLVVFVGDTRLACDGQSPVYGYDYPAPQDDIHSLLRFAASHGAAYGARAGPVGVFGLSSGGQQALLAAYTETGASKPGAVVAWSAPTSFADVASDPDAGGIGNYLGCGYADCPDLWRAASPISHVSRAAPPTLLVSSRDDPQVPATQSRSLDRALRKAGATAALDIEPGAAHAEFGDAIVSRSADFLLQHLG
jgi:acetyl esterase/lipase